MMDLRRRGPKLRLIGKACPKCGMPAMMARRACCSERRRGVKEILKCRRCGYRETVK